MVRKCWKTNCGNSSLKTQTIRHSGRWRIHNYTRSFLSLCLQYPGRQGNRIYLENPPQRRKAAKITQRKANSPSKRPRSSSRLFSFAFPLLLRAFAVSVLCSNAIALCSLSTMLDYAARRVVLAMHTWCFSQASLCLCFFFCFSFLMPHFRAPTPRTQH